MASSASHRKPEGNPAFKYMGLPNIRAKLPSRNWLIFFGVTGTFAGVIYHDRYEQKRIQQLWCSRVAHLALEPLGTLELPRKVTVYLSTPPGNGTDIRPAQQHFRDFVKPIFVAAALDVDFVEGRRMGELREKVAEGVRRQRRMEERGEEEYDFVEETRKKAGITRVGAVQGDVVLGRHAWKEYVQGLHEGWLGPLEAPVVVEENTAKVADDKADPDDVMKADDVQKLDEQVMKLDDAVKEGAEKPTGDEKKTEDEKPAKPLVTPPYILPSSYLSSPLPSSIPPTFEPIGVIPFPFILGFLNTPIRFYRFITRRHLADTCGREAAAIAMGAYSRPFYTAPDPSATMATQEDVKHGLEADKGKSEIASELWSEEGDWPKKYWKDEELQGVWQEDVVTDGRLVGRMRKFFFPPRLEKEATEAEDRKTES